MPDMPRGHNSYGCYLWQIVTVFEGPGLNLTLPNPNPNLNTNLISNPS